MSLIALINSNNIVVEIVVAEDSEIQNLIGITGKAIKINNGISVKSGDVYDPATNSFITMDIISPSIPVEPEPEQAPYSRYIDIGPFFDRFKELKILVLTHPDITIKALITDIQIRKWIDLDLQEVQQALQYLSTKIPQLTSERILEIINTPVADHENLALRKLYFS